MLRPYYYNPIACYLPAIFPQPAVNLFRRNRHVKQPHAASIVHCVGDGRGRRHVGVLADALGLVRAGAILALHQQGFELGISRMLGILYSPRLVVVILP